MRKLISYMNKNYFKEVNSYKNLYCRWGKIQDEFDIYLRRLNKDIDSMK